MNREEARQMASIMTAFANGKEVQSSLIGKDDWKTTEYPSFTSACMWRVKPEPRQWWVNPTNRHTLDLVEVTHRSLYEAQGYVLVTEAI